MGSTPERPRPAPRHRSSTEAFEDTRAVVELLARHRLVVAPHVAARIGLALGGDADAIIEVTARLRSAQRLGHAVLPDPLPLVPAIDAAVALEAAKLAEWERTLLVTASVCVDDRVDVLLAASGRPMVDLIEGEVSRHLLLVAGHFAFADPRMRIWAHGTATLAERTAAHAALAAAYPTLGGERQSTWHRSLSTLEGSAEFVGPLLAIADAADAAGESEWAHAVAREAASHASGHAAIEAWRIAGRAALHGGHVEDARGWLGAVIEHGDELERAAALADYLLARAALEGDVPLGELDDRLAAVGLLGVRPNADGPADRAGGGSSTPQPVEAGALATIAFDLVRASGTAAGLLAERGAPAAAARRLADAARLTRGFRLDPAPLQSATAWCAMYGVGTSGGLDRPDRPASAEGRAGADRVDAAGAADADATGAAPAAMSSAASIARAVELGLGGDPEGAARWLGSLRETSPDPRLAREDRSPMMRAARAVATALLVLWAGDVGRAGQVLARAATDLPIALPFGGLGAALARRICVVASGEVDAFARAVEAAQPPSTVSIRAEELIDRAVTAHLRGARAEAATLVALAGEREQLAGCGLHLPGLDAASGWSVAGPTATGLRRPPDAILASELRRRMRSTDRHDFETDYRAAVDASRGIGSPYERARTELMLARACGEAGAPERAHRHLVTAEHLFTESGAAAWLAAVAAERRVLAACEPAAPGEAPGEDSGATAAEAPAAGSAVPSDDSALTGRQVAEAPSRSNPNDLPRPDRGPAEAGGSEGTLDPDDPLAVCRSVWTDVLTERELEVAMLVVDGASNRDAAARLYVSVRTVEVHLGRVFTKLDVHSRVELAVLAHRMRGLSSASRAR